MGVDGDESRPLRVLVLYTKSTEEVFNRKSALGSYINCLCELLTERYMDVSINGRPFKHLKEQGSISELTTSTRRSKLSGKFPKVLSRVLRDLIIFKKNRILFAEVERKKYDAILEFYSYGSNVGYLLSQKKNIPLLLIYDAPVLEEYSFFNGQKLFFRRLISRRERKSLKSAMNTVVYSNPVKKYLVQRIPSLKSISIHQNVDFSRLNFLEERPLSGTLNIGFIGSFLRWHRVDMLVSCFIKLKQEGFDIKLYLVGDGMEYNSISQLVASSEYRENIIMTGFLDNDQLVKIKSIIHIGVMPGSNWYGAPNKIFEYGAAQMAVIAPDTPTIKDIFQNNNEILFFRQDAEMDLYSKMKYLISDRQEITRLANNLKKKICNQYSAKKTGDFYASLIRSVV